MFSYKIDDIDQWKKISARLRAAGYSRWIQQYGIDRPEGLHVLFNAPDKPEVEIITYDKMVRNCITDY